MHFSHILVANEDDLTADGVLKTIKLSSAFVMRTQREWRLDRTFYALKMHFSHILVANEDDLTADGVLKTINYRPHL